MKIPVDPFSARIEHAEGGLGFGVADLDRPAQPRHPGLRVAHDALTAEIKKTEAELGGRDALFDRLPVPLRRSDHDIDGAIADRVLGSIKQFPNFAARAESPRP